MPGRKTMGADEITVRILNELALHTDGEHGLSVRELSRRLGVTEKTVRNHLQALKSLHPFGRSIRQLTASMVEQADSDDATAGWCMEPVLDVAQLRLLGDSIALSRIDEEYARETYDTLRSLAGYAGRHSGGLRNLRIQRSYNREFLSNVENLDEAISAGRAIGFHMCQYDVDGSLVARCDATTGQPREYRADPYQMTYRNGMYYLLCHMHGRDGVSFVHVDRIRQLEVFGDDVPQECRLDDLHMPDGTPFQLSEYLSERLYPWAGQAEDVTMRVTDLACVFDWFEHPHVRQVGNGVYEVTAHADPTTVLWWALQYADAGTVEILQPQSLRNRLAQVGRTLERTYGTPSDKDDDG